MSVTRYAQVDCSCGAVLEVVVCDSLNAERHPHLRDTLLARELHLFRCDACGEEVFVDKKMTYVDLGRRQFYAVAPDAARDDERALSEELVSAWHLALGDDAPVSISRMFGSSGFNVRMCFGLEELREKIVANDAGLDDLALEMLKAELMRAHQEWSNALVRTLRLDHVEPDGRLAFLFECQTEPTSMLELGYLADRARYDELAAEATESLLERLPGIASGPHVSLLRLLGRPDVAGVSPSE